MRLALRLVLALPIPTNVNATHTWATGGYSVGRAPMPLVLLAAALPRYSALAAHLRRWLHAAEHCIPPLLLPSAPGIFRWPALSTIAHWHI